MTQKRFLSMAILAAAWVAFSAGPTWAQAPGGTKEKSVGGAQSERETGTPMPKEAGKADVKEGKEAKGGMGAGGEKWDVRQAQEALKSKGHDPGPIDGIMGPQTQKAIKAFQGSSGLKETGSLDAETAKKLGLEKGGAASGAPSSEKATSPKESPGREPSGAGKSPTPPTQKEPSSPMGK